MGPSKMLSEARMTYLDLQEINNKQYEVTTEEPKLRKNVFYAA